MSQIFRDEAEIFRILKRLLYFYVKNYAINSATAVVYFAFSDTAARDRKGREDGRVLAARCAALCAKEVRKSTID